MHPQLLAVEDAFLLVVDVQERYRSVLHGWETLVDRARVLIQGAQRLGIPLLYTEQHPRGLGPTCSELATLLEGAPRFEKRTLSALGAPPLAAHLAALGRRQAVVAGIETHACISQTAHQLLEQGFTVHLAVDALSSRRRFDHECGLAKMARAGALGASVEQLLLEGLASADHPEFKAVQQLLK